MTSINSLKHDHKNARKRTDRSAMLIAESLKRYGAARSIVIDEENRILAGNGTIEGAKQAGINNLRIIDAEGDEIIAVRRSGLTEDEKVGLALADNRTSDLSEWDGAMLHQLNQEHDISPWFDAEDLNEIIIDLDEGAVEPGDDNPYTEKVEVSPYEITGPKPELSAIYDETRALQLIQEIENSSATDAEKIFLKAAAYRHVVFNFQQIAEFYAHSNAEVQQLMEDSALVIVDFDHAIKNGWTKLGEELANAYTSEQPADA
jgi:hypothetical protein